MEAWRQISAALGLCGAECSPRRGRVCLGQPPDEEWGGRLRWRTLGEGLKVAHDTSRPLMLIIYRTTCPSCKALKPKIAASEEIQELSAHFVMVNLGDVSDCCSEIQGASYVPRVMFFTPDGRLAEEFHNRLGNPNYKYYYPSVGPLLVTMRQVLERYPPNRRPPPE